MTPLIAQWLAKIGIGAILIASLIGYGYMCGEASKQAEIDADKVQRLQLDAQIAADNTALIKANAEKIYEGEMQHEKDIAIIGDLRSQLDRVRVHFPAGSCTVSGVGATTASADAASGVLPIDVDRAFAKLQSGVTELMQVCDKLNVDAIRMNSRSTN